MLRWNVQTRPWFAQFVQWALYRAIVQCDTPDFLEVDPLSETFGLSHMDDDDLRRMCTALLRASKLNNYCQPTGYQFAVMFQVLDWALQDADVIDDTSMRAIADRYFPAPNPTMLYLNSRTEASDYELVPVNAPPFNPMDRTRDIESCLFTEQRDNSE